MRADGAQLNLQSVTKVAALVLLPALAPGACSRAPDAGERLSAACAVGVEVVRQSLAETDPPQRFRLGRAAPRALNEATRHELDISPGAFVTLTVPPQPVTDLDIPLLKTFLATPGRSLVEACPVIEKEVLARGGHVGDATGEPRLDPKSGLYQEETHSIGLPIVNASGTQALVVSESVSGPLTGGGGIMLWTRDASGHWRQSGWSGLWIS